jgi:DNA-directed RNA polymerase specialized sigma24 family protein
MPERSPAPRQESWTSFESEALPHLDRLFRLAMWFERDRQKAEDLVQDTLLQALRSFHRYTPGPIAAHGSSRSSSTCEANSGVRRTFTV